VTSGKKHDIDSLWGLGNIHNFDEFVRCAALFSSDLDDADRKHFSGHLADVVDTSIAFDLALQCGAEGARRHASMISHPENCDSFGVYRYRIDEMGSGNRDEQRTSLAITSSFSQFLLSLTSLDESRVIAMGISCSRGQLDEARNSQDFVINRTLRGGSVPVAIIEFANDTPRGINDHKEPQLFQYVCNNCTSLPESKSPLTIGVTILDLNHHMPTFQVFGYYQVAENFHVVPITGKVGMQADTLGRLFYLLACFSFNVTEEALPPKVVPAGEPALRFPNGTGGVVCIGDRRVKVFNYADISPTRVENGGRGGRVQDDRRTAQHGLAMLPGARQAWVSDSVNVLIYPHVCGDHQPHHTSCVAACVRHLLASHTRGIMHCDLHLGNFVFNATAPKESRIIDWDYGRPLDRPGKYVSNWNGDLPERHPEARAGLPIRMVHERYSLSRVLSRFVPCQDDANDEWHAICTMAEKESSALEDLARRIDALNSDLTLETPTTPIVETGSPPRDNALATAKVESQLSQLQLG
jgi:hypothetical protein